MDPNPYLDIFKILQQSPISYIFFDLQMIKSTLDFQEFMGGTQGFISRPRFPKSRRKLVLPVTTGIY
jgi:hypothetical protein